MHDPAPTDELHARIVTREDLATAVTRTMVEMRDFVATRLGPYAANLSTDEELARKFRIALGLAPQ